MAQYEEITIDRGSDVSIELELVEADGSKKDLTNYSVVGKVKKNYNSVDSSSASPDVWNFATTITDVYNGIITCNLTNSQTGQMKPGRYVYDVELSYVDSDGNTIVERVLEGRATVTPSVTR